MVLRATWRSIESEAQREFRFQTPLGPAVEWVREVGGRGELVLEVRVEAESGYADPRRFSALGALAYCPVPELSAVGAEVRVTAIPRKWQDAADGLLAYLRRLGINGKIKDRTLILTDNGTAISSLIERAGVALFALDPFSQEFASLADFEHCRDRAVSLFHDRCDEILTLLDQASGGRHLKTLLGLQTPPKKAGRREEAIAAALAKVVTERLVQFHCGAGWLLGRLSRGGGFKKICGVEPSPVLLERAKKRAGLCADLFHGSLIEPPDGLSPESTALLVDALPPARDLRLVRVEEVLFRVIGFEFVLCVEEGSWSHGELRKWAEGAAERNLYRVAVWQICNDSAALFRRTRQSPERQGRAQTLLSEIDTSAGRRVRVTPGQWRSTSDAFSKWTVDPRWLLYLPPGMASLQSEEVREPLEHPRDAFVYYRNEGISKVVVEYKHMGSRAIVVVCRDEEAAESRFGIPQLGCIYTRNGRPFLQDQTELLCALRDGLNRNGFWNKYKTTWVCFDGELLPWTLKAERLLEETHGETLACGEAVLEELAAGISEVAPEELPYVLRRKEGFRRYRTLHQHYKAVDRAVRFAPFHLIATEGRTYFDKNHLWHIQTLGALAGRASEIFLKTPHRLVSFLDSAAVSECIAWWEKLSQSGAEGVVVKPLCFVPRGRRGFAQPAIKCRGIEHLRLVYGPEYDLPENRVRLVNRPALKRRREKHRRVLKQFALAMEAAERFVRHESADRVAECVRGVLALECREF